jgi:hypothetical protein
MPTLRQYSISDISAPSDHKMASTNVRSQSDKVCVTFRLTVVQTWYAKIQLRVRRRRKIPNEYATLRMLMGNLSASLALLGSCVVLARCSLDADVMHMLHLHAKFGRHRYAFVAPKAAQ